MERFVCVLGVLLLMNFVTGHPSDEYPLRSVLFNDSLVDSFDCENEAVWCLRKCCSENYTMRGKTCVWDDSIQDVLNRRLDAAKGADDNFTYLTGMLSCRTYRLDPEGYSHDVFKIAPDGKLVKPRVNNIVDLKSYCVEQFDDIGVSALSCFVEEYSALEKESSQALTIGEL